MIVTDIHHTTDLDQGVQKEPLRMAFLAGDQEAHRFVIHVRRGVLGEPVDLTLAGAEGYFIRADGTTVIMEGVTEGNRAMVTLPVACYVVPGRFSVVIKISRGDTVNTVLYGVGTVSPSRTDVITDPDDVVPSLDELLAIIANLDSVTAEAEKIVERAEDAEGSALDSAKKAEEAAVRAETAWSAFEAEANEKIQTMTTLASTAESAASGAEADADRAQTQASRADAAATQAQSSASSAESSAQAAAGSATAAAVSEQSASSSASAAARDAQAADGSATAAAASATAAASSAEAANEAAERAEAAGGVPEGAIQQAVADYLAENPVHVEEMDPTVPDWAKQPDKPVYTAQEVGALPADTVIPEAYALPTASETVKGGVRIGTGLRMDDDVLSVSADISGGDIEEERIVALEEAVENLRTDVDGKQPAGDYALKSELPSPYVLPTASATEKGGVIVGTGLRMDGDVLSVTESVSADRVAALETDVAGLKTDVGSLQTSVRDLSTDVGTLHEDVAALQSAVVMTTEDPGAGAAVSYPDGTVIHVYE